MKWKKCHSEKAGQREKMFFSFLCTELEISKTASNSLSHAPVSTRNLLLTMPFCLFVFSLRECVPAVNQGAAKSGYEEGDDRNR